MLILAVDTSINTCSVAIGDEKGNVTYKEIPEPHQQSKMLLSMIDDVIKDAGVDLESIDFLATSIGPGSFTGVRIGIAALTGISLAKTIKIIPVSNFEAIASIDVFDKVCVNIDAGRNQVYAQKFENSAKFWDYQLVNYEDFEEYSKGYKALGSKFGVLTIPNAQLILNIAFKLKERATFQVEPLYIRKPDAKISELHV